MLGVNDMAKRKSKKNKYKKMKKILLGVLIGYAVLLLGAYFIGVFYYSKHFYPGSKINGMDCSGKTVIFPLPICFLKSIQKFGAVKGLTLFLSVK